MKPNLLNTVLEGMFYLLIFLLCLITALSEKGIVRTPLLHPGTRQHVEEPPTCPDTENTVNEMVKNSIEGEVMKEALKERNDICNLHIYVPANN